MDGRKEEVLQAEEAILRLGKEAERMGAFNKKLEDVTAQFLNAQGEVEGARKDILTYAESSVSMSKRTEELVSSLNSRYEAVETRLRGIDLEINALRKGVDGFEAALSQTAKDAQEITFKLVGAQNSLNRLYILLIVVLGASVIGALLHFM